MSIQMLNFWNHFFKMTIASLVLVLGRSLTFNSFQLHRATAFPHTVENHGALATKLVFVLLEPPGRNICK